jgi:hypothetical protein
LFLSAELPLLEPEYCAIKLALGFSVRAKDFVENLRPWYCNAVVAEFLYYDTELLGRDEVDERQLVGLKGVVKISRLILNGASLLRLDGFASAGRWEELSPANLDNPQVA